MTGIAKTSETTLAENRPLAVIEAELDLLKQDTRKKEMALLSNYIEVGRRLEEAKAQLPHGEWGGWLKKMEISQSTANNFMRLFREYGADQQSLFDNETKSQVLGNLTYTQAVLLLAIPEEEREQFAVENNVKSMTSRELKKAIKERDEARKAAEQAQKDAQYANMSRISMEKSLKEANRLLGRAREDQEAATSKAADLENQLAELKATPVDVAVMEVDQAQLDAARADGEAAKAEEIARLQAQLEKAQAQATAMADPDVAKFEVYFNEAQENVNKMRGLLLKARGREDQATAEKLTKAILALSEAVRGAAR